jgi:predicted AAA+ superfamily ATPase
MNGRNHNENKNKRDRDKGKISFSKRRGLWLTLFRKSVCHSDSNRNKKDDDVETSL